MAQLKVIRRHALGTMRDDVRKFTALPRYRAGGIIKLDEKDLLPCAIMVPDEIPVLDVLAEKRLRAGSDIENAIKIHRFLGPIPENQARDERLWAYVTHGIFAGYCRDRWPLPSSDEKAASSVISHWFVEETKGLAALRRNAIARLWWAAHLTHAPWVRFSEFESVRCEDEYAFTRTLLVNQDIFQATLERSFGSSQRILVALLATLRADHASRATSPFVNAFAKEINLVSRFREVDALPSGHILPLFEDVARRVRP